MFARFDAIKIRLFFSSKLKELTTFDHQRAWNKLQADLYKKQADFLKEIKAIIANPVKLNLALQDRQLFAGSGSKKAGNVDALSALCGEEFNSNSIKQGERDRLLCFMRESFSEFNTNKNNIHDHLSDTINGENADDSLRVAVILASVCFSISKSYLEANSGRIDQITKSKGNNLDSQRLLQDRVFYPANMQKKIFNEYEELKDLAQRAILSRRLSNLEVDDKKKPETAFDMMKLDVEIAERTVEGNMTQVKSCNPYHFFANKNYEKQQAILRQLKQAQDLAAMGEIAKQYVRFPYIVCSSTMGPLLRSIVKQSDQLTQAVKKRR